MSLYKLEMQCLEITSSYQFFFSVVPGVVDLDIVTARPSVPKRVDAIKSIDQRPVRVAKHHRASSNGVLPLGVRAP